MKDDNNMVVKAKEVLEEISSDEREQYLAELREKYIMNQKAIEDSGFDKGVKSASMKIVKKMKEKNIDINTISEVTGLTIEEIENI